MSKKKYHQFTCSSMILPEHREQLARQQARGRREEAQRRPAWDEQQLEQFQRALEASLRGGAALVLTVLTGEGRKRLAGRVHRLEPWCGRLRLRTAAGTETVLIHEIVEFSPAGPEE